MRAATSRPTSMSTTWAASRSTKAAGRGRRRPNPTLLNPYIPLGVWSTSLPGNPMPDEKPTPEPEGPPAPAAPEKAARPSKKKAEEKEEPKAPRAPKKLEGVKEDFRYIVRIANTHLDGTRSFGYPLTATSGVGIRVSEAVADLAGVPRAESLGNLSEEPTDKIEATLSKLGELFPPWMVNRPKDGSRGLTCTWWVRRSKSGCGTTSI